MNKLDIGDRVEYIPDGSFGIVTKSSHDHAMVLWDDSLTEYSLCYKNYILKWVVPVCYSDFQDKIKDRIDG